MFRQFLPSALAAIFLQALTVNVLAAQVRTTGEIRGSITDASGAFIPNATLKARDLATGLTVSTISRENGAYAFLNLLPGNYEVSAGATGFSTAVIPRVPVETARVVDLNIQLQLGQITESVEVTAEVALLQTTTNTISTTITNKQIQNLPILGRDTLGFAALMTGAQSPGEGTRNSTYNGLPNASLNIAIDGVNNNSQRFKSGGTSFFGFTPARLDAIEEVTVTTAGSGADSSANGAMTIRFMTKRGTNQYHGRVFHQFANDALNANNFFNNARGVVRPRVRTNDAGGNLGGPIPIPGLKNRLFFFANFEAAPRPGTSSRSVNVLTPEAQRGIFSYVDVAGVTRQSNVLQLAAGAGLTGQIDPTVQGLLNTMQSSVANGTTSAVAGNPNFVSLNWNQPLTTNTYYPTARVDYRVTDNFNWHGTWNLRAGKTPGVPNYPGLAEIGNGNKVTTYIASSAFEWALTPAMVNSFNFGVQSNHEDFYQENSIHQWAGVGNRRLNFANVLGTAITPTIPDFVPWIRNNPVYQFTNNLTWVRGKHSWTIGGSLLKTHFYETTWNNAGVLNWTLGASAADPLGSLLPQSLFPSIRTQDLSAAWALYANLTGRINSIAGSRNLDEKTLTYADFAPTTTRARFATGGIFFQDAWRLSSNLTLNYGLRWEVSGAYHAGNQIQFPPDMANFYGPSTGLFQPGSLGGVAEPALTPRRYPYKADKLNPAPNFGFSWNPANRSGLLGRLLNTKTVFKGSYGINYFDEGFNTFTNRTTANPGTTQSINISPGIEFTPGSLNLRSAVPAPTANPARFIDPLPLNLYAFRGASLATLKPEMHTPYVQNWLFSIQRELPGAFVLEMRYSGNRSVHAWHGYRVDETNIFENGFLQEFTNAQRNLAINSAAGVNSFQNLNRAGQVALPIFEAAFGARGGQPALAAGSGWTNGTFINMLQLNNVGTLASSLGSGNAASAQYFCRMVGNRMSPCANLGYTAPGPYPINFFRANPFSQAMTIVDDNSYSSYNGLQIEVRRRLRNGLLLQGSYVWSKTLSDLFNLNSQDATDNYFTVRNRNLDYGRTPFDLRHTVTAFWRYDMPFGKGKKFLSNHRVLDFIAGNWTIAMTHRLHSGAVYELTSGRNTFNNLSDGGVVLTGMTHSELQRQLRTFSPGPAQNLFSAASQLIGAGGRANPQFLSVNPNPGTFAQRIQLSGTPLVLNDASIDKVFRFGERMSFRVQAVASNVFNHPVLNVGTSNIDSTSFGQSSSVLVGARQMQIRSNFDW